MKALITGSAGFVGQHLVEHLSNEGDEVFCSDLSLGGPDLLDPVGVTGLISKIQPDYVYHLAGQADVKASWEDPLMTFRVNAEGTLNVLQACQLSNVKRVLCVSSAEVYGSVQESELPITEKHIINPSNPYAASKSAAEILCKQMNSQDLQIMCARSFNHFGPGQKENFVAAALTKRMLLDQRLGQSEITLFFLRFDFLDELEVGRFSGLVLGLAGHRDVSLGAFLGECGGEFLPIQDGLLELGGIGGVSQLLLELVEQRLQRGPLARV